MIFSELWIFGSLLSMDGISRQKKGWANGENKSVECVDFVVLISYIS